MTRWRRRSFDFNASSLVFNVLLNVIFVGVD